MNEKIAPGSRTGKHAAPGNTAKMQAAKSRVPIRERLRRPKKQHVIIAVSAVLLLLLIISSILLATSDKREYGRYIKTAEQHFETGDFDGALSYLRRAAEIDMSEECMLLMADCYEQQGNIEKALQALRRLDFNKLEHVAQRISDLERQRQSLLDAQKITIAGQQFPPGTTGVVLDGQDITDEILNELKQLYSLDNLSLMNNSLVDISALSELGGLTTLNLSNNSIKDISPLSRLSALRTLYLDGNPVTDFSALKSLTNLSFLSIKGIEISASELESLSAALPSCAIYSNTAAEDVVDITLGGVTFKSDITELDLSDKGITDISVLSECKNLVKLDLSGNEISDLYGLMNIPGLQWLDIAGNDISDLRPLMGMAKLRVLYVSANQVSSTVPLSSLTTLQQLYLSDNPVSDFSGLKNLGSLQTLGIKSTNLDDTGLQYLEYLSSLQKLEIDDNPNISGEAVARVRDALGNCAISHSDLVYSADIGGNLVRFDATELSLPGCNISSISELSSLGYLEKVNLANNEIDNIYVLKFTASRSVIKELDLSSNKLKDITPLSSLSCIETLDISNNQIESVGALLNLKTLRTLYIGGNLLTEDQIETLRESLSSCEIITK